MDLSNEQESKYWFQQAQREQDPEMRKVALEAHRHYHKLEVAHSKAVLRQMKPGYGIRSLAWSFAILFLLVLIAVLGLTHLFSLTYVLATFCVVFAVVVISGAVALRITGKISEDSLLRIVQMGIQSVTGRPNEAIQVSAGINSEQVQSKRLPSNTPSISVDDESAGEG